MQHTMIREVETVITAEGLPFKDFMASTAGKKIAEFLPEHRNSPLRPEVTIAAMMTAGLESSSSMKRSVARINAERKAKFLDPISSNTAAFSKAKARIPSALLAELSNDIAIETAANTPLKNSFLLPIKLIDGTTLILDDTPGNQAFYPQHSQQSEGSGFPIVRAVALQNLQTGMVEGFSFGAFKGKGTGEMALARGIISACQEGDLLIGDAYYPSYFHIASLIARGVHGLFPWDGKRKLDYRTGKALGSLDHIVVWQRPQRPAWMSREEYDTYPPQIEVREFAHFVDGARINFVTTLLDHKKFPKAVLAAQYLKRWNVELMFRDLKTTLGLEHIHAKTPEAVEREIWATILGYNAIRWHQAVAKKLFNKVASQLSIKATIEIILANIPLIQQTSQKNLPRILAAFYHEISQNVVGKRPNRKEPRMVKKRPKPRARMSGSRADWRKAKGLS